MKTQFKIGDKVKILNNSNSLNPAGSKGKISEIDEFDPKQITIIVIVKGISDNNQQNWHVPEDLKLIEPKNKGLYEGGFYGIHFIEDNQKSYILQTKDGIISMFLGNNDITNNWTRNTVEQYIESLKDTKKDFDIYKFSTRKKLIKWMLK